MTPPSTTASPKSSSSFNPCLLILGIESALLEFGELLLVTNSEPAGIDKVALGSCTGVLLPLAKKFLKKSFEFVGEAVVGAVGFIGRAVGGRELAKEENEKGEDDGTVWVRSATVGIGLRVEIGAIIEGPS